MRALQMLAVVRSRSLRSTRAEVGPTRDRAAAGRHAHALHAVGAALMRALQMLAVVRSRSLRSTRAGAGPTRALALLITLGGGFLLKLAYSRAGANELAWVLTPSAAIAQLSVVALVPEPGAGFISRSAHMVVGPACAGVNFLLASWLALYACLQSSAKPRMRGLLGLSVLCLGAAYLATIAVNGLRITLAAELFSLDIYDALWTRARVHRLLGVVLYAAALCALCLAAERLRTRTAQPLRAARALAIALTMYLGVTLGIPLAHRVFHRNPVHFGEHALLTLLGAAAVASLFLLAHRLARGSNRATSAVCSHSESA